MLGKILLTVSVNTRPKARGHSSVTQRRWHLGVRANIHLGGQTEFCPNGFGGGGGSSRHFPGSIFCGGVV